MDIIYYCIDYWLHYSLEMLHDFHRIQAHARTVIFKEKLEYGNAMGRGRRECNAARVQRHRSATMLWVKVHYECNAIVSAMWGRLYENLVDVAVVVIAVGLEQISEKNPKKPTESVKYNRWRALAKAKLRPLKKSESKAITR